jgi:hypothetical protein
MVAEADVPAPRPRWSPAGPERQTTCYERDGTTGPAGKS